MQAVTFLVDLALPLGCRKLGPSRQKRLLRTATAVAPEGHKPSPASSLHSQSFWRPTPASLCLHLLGPFASSLDSLVPSMPSRSRSRSPDYDRSPSRGRSYNSRSRSRSRSPSRRRSPSRDSRSPPPRRNGRTRDSRSRSFTRSRSRDDRARSLSRGRSRSRSRSRSESPLKSTKVGGITCAAHVPFTKHWCRLLSSV